MQLNELLEEHSIKSISDRTMISEDNISRIVAEDFASLSKAKALGFLSILEREYHLDVKAVRKNIAGYYISDNDGEMRSNITLPRVEQSKGRSKLFFFLMLALLGYASWYFFTQFDKKTLDTLMPFSDDTPAVLSEEADDVEKKHKIDAPEITVEENISPEPTEASTSEEQVVEVVTPNVIEVVETVSADVAKEALDNESNVEVVDVETTVTQLQSVNATAVVVAKPIVEENQSVETNESESSTEEETPKEVEVRKVMLTPVKRLWFGLVNMRTGKRDHFTRRKAFPIDVSKGSWLVATSSAPFSLTYKDDVEKFNNGKEHYFKVSKNGITSLSKKEYVRKGGYKKW